MTVTAEPYGQDTAMVFTDRGARIRYGRLSSGQRLLAEAAMRRLITERGSLLDAPNYGLALVDFLGEDMTPAREAALPGLVKLELEKDGRVDRVDVLAVFNKTGPIIEVELTITIYGVETGPFDLVVRASELGVEALALPEAA